MDEIQKVLIKQGRKDLAQKYYEKVAGANYSLYQPTSIEEMMKLSKGTQWDIQAEQYAKMYFGKVVFVLENKKPVAAVDISSDRVLSTRDAEITSGPIFDFVKRKLLVNASSKIAKKGKLSNEDLDKFQTIADDAGGKIYRGYSGRGMYGETCIGITGNATRIIEYAGENGIKGARTDSMGLDDIVYWPNYPDDQGEEREAKKTAQRAQPPPHLRGHEDDEEDTDEKLDRIPKVPDGVYDLAGIAWLDVNLPSNKSAVEAFLKKYPKAVMAAPYEVEYYFLLSERPKRLPSGSVIGSGFNYGSNNIIKNAPKTILILAEND